MIVKVVCKFILIIYILNSKNYISNTKTDYQSFRKIKVGMSEFQVYSILGNCSLLSTDFKNGQSIKLKHYQKRYSLQCIDIYFINGRVSTRTWQNHKQAIFQYFGKIKRKE